MSDLNRVYVLACKQILSDFIGKVFDRKNRNRPAFKSSWWTGSFFDPRSLQIKSYHCHDQNIHFPYCLSYTCNHLSLESLVLTLSLQDLLSNSPDYLSYNSYDISLENLVSDQLIIPNLILFFFLITYLVDIILIL